MSVFNAALSVSNMMSRVLYFCYKRRDICQSPVSQSVLLTLTVHPVTTLRRGWTLTGEKHHQPLSGIRVVGGI